MKTQHTPKSNPKGSHSHLLSCCHLSNSDFVPVIILDDLLASSVLPSASCVRQILLSYVRVVPPMVQGEAVLLAGKSRRDCRCHSAVMPASDGPSSTVQPFHPKD